MLKPSLRSVGRSGLLRRVREEAVEISGWLLLLIDEEEELEALPIVERTNNVTEQAATLGL